MGWIFHFWVMFNPCANKSGRWYKQTGRPTYAIVGETFYTWFFSKTLLGLTKCLWRECKILFSHTSISYYSSCTSPRFHPFLAPSLFFLGTLRKRKLTAWRRQPCKSYWNKMGVKPPKKQFISAREVPCSVEGDQENWCGGPKDFRTA